MNHFVAKSLELLKTFISIKLVLPFQSCMGYFAVKKLFEQTHKRT